MMFRQLCFLALLAVTYGQYYGYQDRAGGATRQKGLLPPYPLNKLFGDPDCMWCYNVYKTTTIPDKLCDTTLDLAKFSCFDPKFVNITVRDWQLVRDIVVPVPSDYSHIKVHRSQPCSGDSLVEIHAKCWWVDSKGY